MTESISESKIKWLPTYNLMITKNILAKLGIYISSQDLFVELEMHNSPYRELCQVPMMHIFNNLILAQIKSYQEFIQKRLIDYFVQNNPTQEELELLGKEQNISEAVLNSKERYLNMKKATQLVEQRLMDNISASQAFLKGVVKKQNMFFEGEVSKEFHQKVDGFKEYANELQLSLVTEKNHWREFSTNVCMLLSELGNFRITEIEDIEQRAELQFLQNLGEGK